jgi:hypothetical protein
MVSRLQHTEVPLGDFEGGWVVIEPGGEPHRSLIQLQHTTGPYLLRLSPEEAYVIGSSLVEHATECGFDYDTGKTTPPGGSCRCESGRTGNSSVLDRFGKHGG